MQNELENSQPGYLLRFLYRLLDRILLIRRRLQYHAGLTLLTLLGIILSVGLVTNASFFAEGVDRVILLQNLAEFSRVTGRPPFSTNVYIFPSNRAPLTLEDSERLAPQIGNLLSSEVGLHMRRLVLSISSGTMLMQPELESPLYGEGKDYLGNFSAIYMNDIAQHMAIDQGVELDEEGVSGSVLDVWMYASLVQEMGLHVDEQFIIRPDATKNPVSIRLAGIWHAEDPENEFWFGNPDRQLKDSLIVRRADYIKFIQPMVPSGSREASWYVILDENKMVPGESASYLAGFEQSQILIDQFLPGVRFNMPPLDPLENFVQRSTSLTVILLGYNLPAFLILLYFLLLISTITAKWQRAEISVFLSRGASIFGITNLTLLEQLLLFIICLPLGIIAGLLIARMMGYTTSFLSFTERVPLPVSLQGFSIPLLVLALGVSLVSRIWPILRTDRQNVIAEGHEWARITQGPFWYRAYLDFLLLLPTYYAYSQISQRGSLAGLIVSQPEDLYQDPLLIVVPALFVVTAALMTMRLFSIVMRILDILANRTPWLPIHLALRQLGRQSHEYINPLLLVIIALAMGIYTLSMATSLDQWLIDRMYYRAGADITFLPQPLIEGKTFTDGNWIPSPVDFTEVEGVLSATRVGSYTTIISPPGEDDLVGKFVAIDRLDFANVAWWRYDLASESLGGLMNRLAASPENVLVSQDFLTNYGSQIGDQLPIEVNITDYFKLRYQATIAGVFDYFPTVYEEEGYTLVGNMNQLVLLSGSTPTHEIWLKIAPQANEAEIRQALPGTVNVVPNVGQDARVLISQEEANFERVGIFGTLSIGFLASAIMAILGLLIYSYASLRGRMYRFSVLHAVGLLHRQIVAQVVIEYTFLAIFGAFAGTLIGVFAARLFVPFFRFTGEIGVPLPPLIPLMDDQSIINLAIIFSLVVVSTEVLTITSALRQKLERIR
jgi:putative ABC transport system permease protein